MPHGNSGAASAIAKKEGEGCPKVSCFCELSIDHICYGVTDTVDLGGGLRRDGALAYLASSCHWHDKMKIRCSHYDDALVELA